MGARKDRAKHKGKKLCVGCVEESRVGMPICSRKFGKGRSLAARESNCVCRPIKANTSVAMSFFCAIKISEKHKPCEGKRSGPKPNRTVHDNPITEGSWRARVVPARKLSAVIVSADPHAKTRDHKATRWASMTFMCNDSCEGSRDYGYKRKRGGRTPARKGRQLQKEVGVLYGAPTFACKWL